MRRTVVVVLAVAIMAGVAGCGVPSDGRPRALSASGVPFGLLDLTPPTTVPDVSIDESNTAIVDIYLLSPAGRLVAVQRKVAIPVNLVSVLLQLVTGPSTGETAVGYQSLISTQTRLIGAPVVAGVANVNVSREFLEASPSVQILALAQIVYTATAVPGVQAVSFSLEGEPREVPTQDGTLAQRPLTRTDYARLAEP